MSFWPILCAFGVTTISVYLLKQSTNRLLILDHPNERSLHRTPTPRSGGLGMWAGWVVGIIMLIIISGIYKDILWIACAALLVAVVSLVDDLRHVSAAVRIVTHLFAAGILLTNDFRASMWWPSDDPVIISNFGLLINILYIVWITNSYNFMDGMDGFAGGMAIFGFGTLGILGHLAGNDYYATLCWIIAASTAGFLVWNFPPARIFMGDTGSSVLGLLVAALSLWADRDGLFPLWLTILVFMPFIFDATLTLARRTLQGERVWEAHRSHYYQRLVQSGWSHRRTVLWEYGLMLLCSVGALCAFRASMMAQWMIIGVILGACLAGVVGVRHIERRQSARQTSDVSS